LTFGAWQWIYLPLHKRWLGRRTAIHPDASLEYHALTSILWWARLFPVTIERMRFSLSQLTVWAAEPPPGLSPPSRFEEILRQPCPLNANVCIPATQKDYTTVHGLWIHVADQPTEYTLFWIYGGAFLSGDVHGNSGPAERVGRETGMDVFLPTHRLVPEANVNDMLWDICLAYRWLCQRRSAISSTGRNGDSGSNSGTIKIFLFGISSGAALALRLMQSIAETRRGEPTLPSYLHDVVCDLPMPAGAVLAGPFVDFTVPDPQGTLVQYAKHDLIVTERVLETGLPYLDTHAQVDDDHGGDRATSTASKNVQDARQQHSPVYRSFQDIPPLCVVVSEHEAVFDHAVTLINRARAAGIPVTVGLWKYVCHVFTFLSSFIPEGEQSVQFLCEWLRQQQQQQQQPELQLPHNRESDEKEIIPAME